IIVQIGESKFTKNIYGRSDGKDGKRVLGGVEITSERNMFMVAAEDRTESTLLNTITQFVKLHYIIFIELLIIQEFATEDDVNTNTIEGNWSAAKCAIRPAQRRNNTL
ncbi:hypothetical protein BY458DRAFT_574668, partial [Sporodiniella umbellata]